MDCQYPRDPPQPESKKKRYANNLRRNPATRLLGTICVLFWFLVLFFVLGLLGCDLAGSLLLFGFCLFGLVCVFAFWLRSDFHRQFNSVPMLWKG